MLQLLLNSLWPLTQDFIQFLDVRRYLCHTEYIENFTTCEHGVISLLRKMLSI